MAQVRKITAVCPICKNRIDLDVSTEMVENAPAYPVSVVIQHGKPSHFMIVFVDAEYRVRGVEGHGLVLTEDTTHHDALDLALAERKSINRLAEMPDLLKHLNMIRGIEFADSKGVAIVSLSEAGPTTGTITSPTGRLKGRFVVRNEENKGTVSSVLTTVITALETVSPLSPATLVLLLKVVEESLSANAHVDPSFVTRIAESTTLTPITSLKTNVFRVMCEHTLTSDNGALEVGLVMDRIDGRSSLLSLMRLVEEKGLSLLRLLVGLDILSKNDAITLTVREDLSKH